MYYIPYDRLIIRYPRRSVLQYSLRQGQKQTHHPGRMCPSRRQNHQGTTKSTLFRENESRNEVGTSKPINY